MNIAGFRSKTHTVRTPRGDMRLTIATVALSDPAYVVEMVRMLPKAVPGRQPPRAPATILTLRRDSKPAMSHLLPSGSSITDTEEALNVLVKEATRLAGETA